MQKLIYVVVIGCLLLAAKAFSEPLPPTAQLVKNIVEQRKLISYPKCVDYFFQADFEPGVDTVDVVEKHGGNCPGDPQVQHRLFSVFVNKKTHEMASDIDDPAGDLSVFPPKQKR